MKHLRLLGMESEREALLKAMQDMECVEISSIDGSEEALKSGFAKPDDKALMSAQEASRAYRTALASLDRFAPEKKGMFRKRQGVSRAAFFSAESEENARTAAETINKDTRRLGEIESERTKNEALRATLAPWLTVDAPLGGADGALAVFFGTVGLNVTDDALKALADSLDGLLTWQQASSDRSLRYLLVMCHGHDRHGEGKRQGACGKSRCARKRAAGDRTAHCGPWGQAGGALGSERPRSHRAAARGGEEPTCRH